MDAVMAPGWSICGGTILPALRQMKYMPDLQFRIDTRFDDDSRIDELLKTDRVARDITAKPDGGDDD